jgi:hypothetical protein
MPSTSMPLQSVRPVTTLAVFSVSGSAKLTMRTPAPESATYT